MDPTGNTTKRVLTLRGNHIIVNEGLLEELNLHGHLDDTVSARELTREQLLQMRWWCLYQVLPYGKAQWGTPKQSAWLYSEEPKDKYFRKCYGDIGLYVYDRAPIDTNTHNRYLQLRAQAEAAMQRLLDEARLANRNRLDSIIAGLPQADAQFIRGLTRNLYSKG